MSFFTCIVARRALSAFGFLALTAGTQAQTLNGIRIGEEITTASQFAGKPTSRAVAGPHAISGDLPQHPLDLNGRPLSAAGGTDPARVQTGRNLA